jgi:alkyl hydroperoxide reductase subunit D
VLALDVLRDGLPDGARDIKLNLSAVLGDSSLSASQRWGVAVASAAAARYRPLLEAVVADARREVGGAAVDDALAAATLMAMNNVFYRFRHVVGKEIYSTKRAGLRMNRLGRPAGTKVDMELFSLAVSAINNCEACVRAHEKAVVDGGLTEDQVNDAIRIAATIAAAAVALETAEVAAA